MYNSSHEEKDYQVDDPADWAQEGGIAGGDKVWGIAGGVSVVAWFDTLVISWEGARGACHPRREKSIQTFYKFKHVFIWIL